jgi:transcription initiation factor IIE alpha subunit
MELCEDGHDQICFDSRNCPLCEELKKQSDFEDEIYNLKEKIRELEEQQNG